MTTNTPNDQPLVSVCIPAYNAEAFIAEAVESVLGQSYPNVEVICIDDGSRDRTAEILRSFGERIVFESIPNGGAQRARNLALAKARGEFVHFLDADNYLLPDCIATKVHAALTTGAELVFSNQVILKDCGERQHLRSRKSPAGMDPFLYCLRYNLPGGTTAIDTNVALHRTAMVRRVHGFRHGVAPCDDKDLAFRLTAAGAQLAYVDEELTVYRDHAGPRISTAPRNPAYPLDYFVGLLPVLTGSDLYQLGDERANALQELVLRLAKTAYREGERALAEQAFELIQTLGHVRGTDESVAYRAMRSLLGYARTEWLRSRFKVAADTA